MEKAMRCKLACTFKDNNVVHFGAVYTGSQENKEFFAATPGANFSLYCVVPEILARFQPGQEYYVDFVPAAQPVAAADSDG